MHRSRIGVVLLDHPAPDAGPAAAFWSAALGRRRTPADAPPGEVPYESLGTLPSGVQVQMQRTGGGTAPRIHVDMETDDVEAETARLIALGATMHEEREGYNILADPAGLVFCVVPVQSSAEFDESATVW